MELDPSLANNYGDLSFLSREFPENPWNISEIPTMVPVQPNSTLSPTPSHDAAFLYQNSYQNFKQHPLNGAKHCSSLSMEGPSSNSQFCMIPTPSYESTIKDTHTSGSMTDSLRSSHPMSFSPNNNKTEVMHVDQNGGKHNSSLSMEGPSSSSQFRMIPTPSYGSTFKDTLTSGSMTDFLRSSHPLGFSPNNNKTEVMHGDLNGVKHYSSLSMESPSSVSQFRVIPAPSYGSTFKDTHTSGSMTDFLRSSHPMGFSPNNNNTEVTHVNQNGANNYSSLSMEGPASNSQFRMIPTPSYGSSFKDTHTNGSMTDFLKSSHPTWFSPNNKKTEVMRGDLHGAKHYSSRSMEGPSSISQLCMIPTPSYESSFKDTHKGGSMADFLISSDHMGFSPNNNKTEVMHGDPNSGINYLDFTNSNPLQYNAISKSQGGLSLSPLFYNDALPSVPVKPMLQDEPSHSVGSGNIIPHTDLILEVDDEKKQCRVEMENNEVYQSDTSRIQGQWAEDEDRVLKDLVKRYGTKKWSEIAKFIYGRNGKQCRKRWVNHLRPNLKKDSLSEDEEKILIKGHRLLGNKWEQIARLLPGRAENTIKNHWNNIKRRVNGKRKQNGSNCGLEGTLLEKYIQEVTNANAN